MFAGAILQKDQRWGHCYSAASCSITSLSNFEIVTHCITDNEPRLVISNAVCYYLKVA